MKQADKFKYAAPTSILIDDYDKNIDAWREHGGIAIKHTSAAKTIRELERLLGE